MKIRLISAAIAIPLGILIIFLNNVILYTLVCAVLSVVAVYEILLATKYLKNKLITFVSLFFVFSVPFIFTINIFRRNVIAICFTFLFLLFVIMLFMHDKVPFEELAVVGFVSVCIPLSFSSILFCRVKFEEHAIFIIVFILLSAWIGDAGAYFIGTFFGKHKMAPKISPKKSWEGFIGGIVTSGIFGILLAYGYEITEAVMYGSNTFVVNKPFILVISLLCAVLGVVGDFTASIIKRQCAVKDFGNILPGHGGVLDRFDSVLFVAPFVYHVFQVYMPITSLVA